MHETISNFPQELQINNEPKNESHLITRREFCLGIGALTALALAGCKTTNPSENLANQESKELGFKEIMRGGVDALENIGEFKKRTGYVPIDIPTADEETNKTFDILGIKETALMNALDTLMTKAQEDASMLTLNELDVYILLKEECEKESRRNYAIMDEIQILKLVSDSDPQKTIKTWQNRTAATPPQPLPDLAEDGNNAFVHELQNLIPNAAEISIEKLGIVGGVYTDLSFLWEGINDRVALDLDALNEESLIPVYNESFKAILVPMTLAHELTHYYDLAANSDFLIHFDEETLAELFQLRNQIISENLARLTGNKSQTTTHFVSTASPAELTLEGLYNNMGYPLADYHDYVQKLTAAYPTVADEISNRAIRKENEGNPIPNNASSLTPAEQMELIYGVRGHATNIVLKDTQLSMPEELRKKAFLEFRTVEREMFCELGAIIMSAKYGILDGKITEANLEALYDTPQAKYIEKVIKGLGPSASKKIGDAFSLAKALKV